MGSTVESRGALPVENLRFGGQCDSDFSVEVLAQEGQSRYDGEQKCQLSYRREGTAHDA